MTEGGYPDGCAKVMTIDELRQLERDLKAPDERRLAEAGMRAFWRSARSRYSDLKVPDWVK